MCGIIGYFSPNVKEVHLPLLYSLMLESSIRGLHSFGLAYYRDREQDIITKKWLGFPRASELDNITHTMIFHNRYSTSGDWENQNNNMPITLGDISVAVNGVISMKSKSRFNKEFKVNCHSENDAEIFAQKLAMGKLPPAHIIKKELGSASFAAVYIRDGEVFAIRNRKRPLYYFIKYGAVFVVSTIDIARRALGERRTAINMIRPLAELRLSERL